MVLPDLSSNRFFIIPRHKQRLKPNSAHLLDHTHFDSIRMDQVNNIETIFHFPFRLFALKKHTLECICALRFGLCATFYTKLVMETVHLHHGWKLCQKLELHDEIFGSPKNASKMCVLCVTLRCCSATWCRKLCFFIAEEEWAKEIQRNTEDSGTSVLWINGTTKTESQRHHNAYAAYVFGLFVLFVTCAICQNKRMAFVQNSHTEHGTCLQMHCKSVSRKSSINYLRAQTFHLNVTF